MIFLCLLLLGCNSGTSVTLPGQTQPASEGLINAVNEVENKLHRKIHFYEVTNSSSLSAGEGLLSFSKQEVSIYLNSTLEQDIQEAVAAHELAHILQIIDGYFGIVVQEEAEALYPGLSVLASSISSLALDVSANNWAESRGFKIQKMLDYQLTNIFKFLDIAKNQKKLGYIEASNWESCNSWLRSLSNGEKVETETPKEVNIMINALRYTTLKLNLIPYDLFSELEESFNKNMPVAKSLGEELYKLVKENGIDNQDELNTISIRLAYKFKLPSPLFQAVNFKTGEAIWFE